MSTAKKIIASTSGNAASEGAYVEDVFSTFVYTGTASSLAIVNDIDLNGEGGLVWLKNRDQSVNHALFDTERGAGKGLETSTSAAQTTAPSPKDLGAFNSNGFTLDTNYGQNINTNGEDYASWTFRKAPKFFDVVTYTGNGTAGRQIAHNLGTTVGALIVKRTNSTGDWSVFHRKLNDGTNPANYRLELQGEVAQGTTPHWNNTVPSSTTFTVGSSNTVNGSDHTYVAYLFAHNDGDGEFGSASDQDIIKCGNYTGNGSSTGPEINLGFEPQWLMIKSATEAENWHVWDNIRGVTTGGTDPVLYPNIGANETTGHNWLDFTSTGFQLSVSYNQVNKNSAKYVYMAIRRGPMKAPENATDVFAIESYTGTGSAGNRSTNILVDAIITTRPAGAEHKYLLDRMRGGDKWLRTETDEAEGSQTTGAGTFGNNFLQMLGNGATINSSSFSYVNHLFRRAPGFFDLVAYTGDGNTNKTITHNLNAVPKFIIIKGRSFTSEWLVYSTGSSNPGLLNTFLNKDENATGLGAIDKTGSGNTVIDSTTQFDVEKFTGGNASKSLNTSGEDYIALIFGSLDGISKVGGYTGTGSTLSIDCGFSNGVKFVLIKQESGSGLCDWYFFDSVRGIGTGADPAGRDPALFINRLSSHSGQGIDFIDSISSGFKVHPDSSSFGAAQVGKINTSGKKYIFYAIAV